MPWMTPLLSASEKPATPVETPQVSAPLALMSSIIFDPVCAAAGWAMAAASIAAPPSVSRLFM